jgi:signal transduction histidine kinase
MKMLRDENLGRRGKLPITQLEIITKQGQHIPVEMTAAIIYEDGEEVATAGIFNDLREKLAVEQKLYESQVKIGQTEKMASLGRLAAGVAHEINNPLTSILMYGSIIREKLEQNHPLSQNLDYVLEDADRCKNIVKNLLAYSRQSSPTKEVFPLNALVTESLRLLHDQRLFQHVEIVQDLIGLEVLIRADKNQICQVVINLILNSVDAMEEQGTLTLSTSMSEDKKMACLSVTDTGSGISADDVSKIFDPFFTTKAPGKGTGLGLSMAYGVLEENQGRIYVKETGPGGTTITLELPVVTLSNEILFDSIG